MQDELNASPISRSVYCFHCGYNLRGLTSNKCPECGNPLEGMRVTTSAIPWQRPRTHGLFVSYWKTVLYVIFQQRTFRYEMARDVSYADARQFRFYTILIPVVSAAFLALLVVQLLPTPLYIRKQFLFRGFDLGTHVANSALAAGWPLVLTLAAFAMALFIMTEIPGRLARTLDMPDDFRYRAVTLCLYTSAPLAWSFVPVAIALLAWIAEDWNESIGIAFYMLAAMVLVLVVAVWWSDTIRLLRHILPHLGSRLVLHSVLIPLLWLVVLGYLLGIATGISALIAVMVESLRS